MEQCKQREFEDYYTIGDYLAEGSFGKVYKGYQKETNRLVAVKIISKLKMEETDLEVQINEIEILKSIEHKHVVRLFDHFEDPNNIYLVLEYLEGTSLLKYVVKMDYLKEPLCQRVMREILSGLSYLHDIGIIHRDIKLDNIMMVTSSAAAAASEQE
jgi:serine/threonine protein kinase